jgi:hypothetical protein
MTRGAPPAEDRVPLGEPLLKVQDVAHLLRLPRSTVYELARRRHDPSRTCASAAPSATSAARSRDG